MGYTTSTVHGIEVPDASEANDVPEDIGKVVTALEGGSIVRRLTGAAIAALTAPEKPAGVYFHNTTTGKLMVSDGTTVVNADTAAYAIGVRTSTINVTHNSWWTVTYTAETDPLGMLSSTTATIPTAGLWQIDGSATMSLMADDGFKMELWHNGAAITGIPYPTYDKAGASMQITFQVRAVIAASASDTFALRLWHYNSSGGARDCLGARLSVARLGT